MNVLPFDKIAGDYDAQFTNTQVGKLQRLRVYYHLNQLLQKKTIRKVLEFNCGTGADAYWLAERNCQVLSTDNSKEMIQQARQKAAQLDFNFKMPDFQVLGFEESQKIISKAPFDLVLSNFGGINCMNPHKLNIWAKDMATILRPGDFLVAVVLGRFCAWESVYFSLKGNWSSAWRRRQKGSVEGILTKGVSIPIWYYSPKDFSHYFKQDFSINQIYPIGFALPPSYLNPFFQKHPQWLNYLNKIENRLGHQAIWAQLADHYLVILQKR